jgi:hypothetical protein
MLAESTTPRHNVLPCLHAAQGYQRTLPTDNTLHGCRHVAYQCWGVCSLKRASEFSTVSHYEKLDTKPIFFLRKRAKSNLLQCNKSKNVWGGLWILCFKGRQKGRKGKGVPPIIIFQFNRCI